MDNFKLIIVIVVFGNCVIHTTALYTPVETNQTGRAVLQERTYTFSSSITYWDFDNDKYLSKSEKDNMKQGILDELIHIPSNAGNCTCSKLLGPFVCDSMGKLHSNICIFHCKLSTGSSDLRPTMILLNTSIKKSRLLCQQKFGLIDEKEGSSS